MDNLSATEILPEKTEMGKVVLYVADLDLVTKFYHEGVGLEILSQTGGTVELGRKGRGVITIEQKKDLAKAALGSAGLYHSAVLFDTKAQLAAAVYSVATKFPGSFTRSSDHFVSNAFYFDDPEGNGVELYWDRPRVDWKYNTQGVDMGTVYLDPNRFLQENLSEEYFESEEAPLVLRDNALIGHVHLQVGDINQAADFYIGSLGFEKQIMYGTQALFVSAGGYHHHVGMNTWHSGGAGFRTPALGLGSLQIVLPTQDEITKLTDRLKFRGVEFNDTGAGIEVRDPWLNRVDIRLA